MTDMSISYGMGCRPARFNHAENSDSHMTGLHFSVLELLFVRLIKHWLFGPSCLKVLLDVFTVSFWTCKIINFKAPLRHFFSFPFIFAGLPKVIMSLLYIDFL